MFIPCPHCGFLVALIVSRDPATQRCPRCRKLLQDEAAQSSSDTSAEVAAGAAQAPLDSGAATGSPTSRQDDAKPPAGAGTPGMDESPTPDPPPAVPTAPVPKAKPTSAPPPTTTPPLRRNKRATPSFARRAAPLAGSAGGRRWPGRGAILVLVVVLLLQLLLAQRERLAASARWRPTVAAACSVLQCRLPPWRQPEAFTMLGRAVQPAPNRPGALLVSASFRNDARWPQPWPRLLLTLSDANGQAVAQRLLTPAEYRGGTDGPSRLAPGQSAGVRFEVIEPGRRTVAFQFDFR